MGWLSSACSILCLFVFVVESLAFPLCRHDQSSALSHFSNSFSISKPHPYISDYCDYYNISDPKTSSWESSTNCCLWDGVTCDAFGYVIGLHLTCSWLHGQIHPNSTLYSLTHLQTLNLSFNDFQGSQISSQIQQLVSLTQLDLFLSNFSGEVPSQISHLHKLVSLYLDDDLSLDPSTWERLKQNLTHIRELDLFDVDMSSIPPTRLMMNLSSSLVSLRLENARLHGNLEEIMHWLPHLEELYLGFNENLTGSFPLIITNSSKSLRRLYLAYTGLSGELPHSIGLMKSLTHLDLSSCQFVGTIPASFWNLTQLTFLNLSFNNFSGQIGDLSWNKNMHYLDLSSNLLHGQLPTLPISTIFFSVSHNNFTGPIFSSICNVTSLEVLNLSYNNFTATIPQCIGHFSPNLSVLDLQMNRFSGIVPTTFEKGNMLRTLNLHGNLLEGSLPQSLANCTQLEVLDLGRNNIKDVFPHWLGKLQELQVLVLRENKLHGSIAKFKAKSLQSFSKLRILDLSNNNFDGSLPATFFKSLKAVMNVGEGESGLKYMDYLSNSSSYQYLDSIDITLKGIEIHMERILTILTSMDLSKNKFEGEIPQVIGELGSLKGLSLSHNGFTGCIPESLGNLRSLEWLDLSSNKLRGEIPMELTSLNFLSVLNLSHNQLEGCIPSGQQFNTFTSGSFEGNVGLRGSQIGIACKKEERREEGV